MAERSDVSGGDEPGRPAQDGPGDFDGLGRLPLRERFSRHARKQLRIRPLGHGGDILAGDGGQPLADDGAQR